MTVEELTRFGLAEMADEAIEGFLASHSVGTLGLPTDAEPYLIPMSYGYDGGSRLYFTFVSGEHSRKAELADRTERATFLIYSAETAFNWRSVRLTGPLRELPEDERRDLPRTATSTWRPELFDAATGSLETRIYEFRIGESSGFRHTGLPPGFDE